jgi:hypothetical protein
MAARWMRNTVRQAIVARASWHVLGTAIFSVLPHLNLL